MCSRPVGLRLCSGFLPSPCNSLQPRLQVEVVEEVHLAVLHFGQALALDKAAFVLLVQEVDLVQVLGARGMAGYLVSDKGHPYPSADVVVCRADGPPRHAPVVRSISTLLDHRLRSYRSQATEPNIQAASGGLDCLEWAEEDSMPDDRDGCASFAGSDSRKTWSRRLTLELDGAFEREMRVAERVSRLFAGLFIDVVGGGWERASLQLASEWQALASSSSHPRSIRLPDFTLLHVALAAANAPTWR